MGRGFTLHFCILVLWFIQMACSGALPTCRGLHKRIDSISASYFRCGCGEENETHALLYCYAAVAVWEEACLVELVDRVKVV